MQTFITSIVRLDPTQLGNIVTTATTAAPLVNPQFAYTPDNGTFTVTADRVLTSSEITAVKAACTAALFVVTHS